VSDRRLLELWAPPTGFRLASVLATTYECQADFVEEDLLPVALDLRLPAARGRDFRLELEHALQDVEVTVFLHPERYQPGLRRSPRVDLVPLPEGRFPKLHAKVALLRFAPEQEAAPNNQIIRLVVASANLTNPGYRSNIEVAVAVDDAPGAAPAVVTAVRDAANWLRQLLGSTTEQASRQLRDLDAVFAARPVAAVRTGVRFVGLPRPGGLVGLLSEDSGDRAQRVTVASPFWPAGEQPADVVDALGRACGGLPANVRLIGPAEEDDSGRVYPVIPAALVRALLEKEIQVEVAAADPRFGCGETRQDEDDEFGELASSRSASTAHRALHAKLLLIERSGTTQLAAGSFNLTRRGLGLHGRGNAEAGLIWTLPSRKASAVRNLVAFATEWRTVDRAPEDLVREPPGRDDGAGDGWPVFVIAIRARQESLELEGDVDSWPGPVDVRMRDIRSRLVGEEQWFDTWTVTAPESGTGSFVATTELAAGWLAVGDKNRAGDFSRLPDLEAEISWEDGRAVVPVIFIDKHLFPVVESRRREDERALIDWFLGLRPPGEAEGDGFGHGIDPIEGADAVDGSPTSDILSYLVRDFVHALPGIRARLAEASLTETGLRAALLGPRSPVGLAREVVAAWRTPATGGPRKTPVATAFQLVELLRVVEQAVLPELADGATARLRQGALDYIRTLLQDTVSELPPSSQSPVLNAYLGPDAGGDHAAT